MFYQFFRKESTPFTPKNTLLERILATSLAHYEEHSLDDDSFVSQSRFDANAMLLRGELEVMRLHSKSKGSRTGHLIVFSSCFESIYFIHNHDCIKEISLAGGEASIWSNLVSGAKLVPLISTSR